ncbi:MAG: hypothetical protein AVDCRST_MAG77-4529 [uncultured Chloroflexi bacterium]|uniref:D-Glucosaminate-6-phosphate ammonia-lyase n=1 Tax=uncultured Chloroflexota bacterium TaxID=166587 RepID=A0A6J4JWR5_9CHLR|nr:MAG: hypothetical protein AVDCRST_MAG77-4529 [uncultured Chloroflexota bacterium]
MNVYGRLGVEPVINAAGTLTRYGSSLMLPEVVEAMVAASGHFVDMTELHVAAGDRIARLIGVEACHVCAGAAAGITLMAAATMAGSDPAKIKRLPDAAGMPSRFVVQRAHHNPFDQALRLTGGTFVDVGPDHAEIETALRRHRGEVAAVYATVAWFCLDDALAVPEMATLAHAAGVPLVVDAAAEVPPLANLTRFLREGADLVAFSGGKAIRGPQASGFILGRADLVEACRLNDGPNSAVGRPMKIGKEEIVGLVAAVESYVSRDHAADAALWERRVAHVVDTLAGLPGVRAWRQLPRGIGQLIPHAAVGWDEGAIGVTHAAVQQALLAGPPRIATQRVDAERYAFGGYATPELRIHPHTLQEGEVEIVAAHLRERLSTAPGTHTPGGETAASAVL